MAELEMFSLEELVRTRAGDLGPALRRVMARGLEHVRGCDLCQARGHLCTLCSHNTAIYPFMVSDRDFLKPAETRLLNEPLPLSPPENGDMTETCLLTPQNH